MADLIGSNSITDGDAGNSMALANLLTATGTVTVTGSVGGSDTNDFYKFVAPVTGVELTVLSLTKLTADIDLVLFDANGTRRASSANSGKNDESISDVLIGGQTYYVQLQPYQGAVSDYTFTLTPPTSSSGLGGDAVNGVNIGDASEFNPNRKLGAVSWAAITGTAGGSDTADYYIVDALASGTLSLNLSGLTDNLDMLLYNGRDTSATGVVTRSTSAGTTAETITWAVTGGETYIAAIVPSTNGGPVSNYKLAIGMGNDAIGDAKIGDAGNTGNGAANISGSSVVTGAVGGIDTNDFYKFVPTQSGTANLTLGNLAADLDLRLIDSTGATVASSTLARQSTESINYAVTKDQTYYVQVYPGSSIASSAYNLNIVLPGAAATTTVVGDVIRGVNIGDAANNPNSANNLGAGPSVFTITGTESPSDTEDIFTFVASATGTVDLMLRDFSVDLDLRLMNSLLPSVWTGDKSPAFIKGSFNGGTTAESISATVTAGQTYYVRVSNFSGQAATTKYSLDISLPSATITTTLPGGDTVSGVQMADAGNTMAGAQSVSGSASISGRVGGTDTDDFYKITASQGGTATLNLSGLGADIDLKLLDAAGASLATSARPGTSSEAISFAVIAGQTYYVQVNPYGAATSTYNLDVVFPVAGLDTVYGTKIGDAGDSAIWATALNGSGTATGSVGGTDIADYYKVVVPTTSAGGNFNVKLTGPSNVRADILRADGSSLGGWPGSSPFPSLDVAATPGQTFYVKVISAFSTGSGDPTYTLDVTTPWAGVTAVTAGNDTIAGTVIGDAGNGTSSASMISNPGVVTGSVGGGDTDDYYKFVPSQSGVLTVGLSGLVADLDLKLMGSNGSTLALSAKAGASNENVSYPVIAGQTYYVQVDPYSTASSSYSLNLGLAQGATSSVVTDVIAGTSIGDAGNNLAVASLLGGSGTVTGVTGGIDTGDYYKFVAAGSGTVSLALTGLTGDLDLKLLDGNGTALAASTLLGIRSENVNFVAVQGQTYYFQVAPVQSASSSYNLSVAVPAGSSLAPAVSGGDYIGGVSIGDAGNIFSPGVLTESTSVKGTVRSFVDTVDIYTFVPSQDGTFVLTGPSTTQDLGVRLVDAANSSIAPFDTVISAGTAFNLSGSVVAGSTYRFVVAPTTSNITSYFFNIVVPGLAAAPTNDAVGGVDIGDASGATAAASVLTASGLVTGTVGASDTADIYKFVAAGTGSVHLSLGNASANLNLSLVGGSGSVLVPSAQLGTAVQNIDFAVTAGQTYFVQVVGDSTMSSNYSLDVVLPAAGSGSDSGSGSGTGNDMVGSVGIGDAGNTSAAASLLSVTAAITGSVGGTDADDFYKFVPTQTGTVTLSLSGLSADIDLKLLDSAGTSLATSARPSTNTESISYAVTAGQTYYIDVHPFLASASNYNLNFTLVAGSSTGTSAPAANDTVAGTSITDAGNSLAAAYTLSGTARVTGSVGGTDTDDYFKVVPTQAGTVSLNLAGLTSDIDLRLLDAFGVSLASSTLPRTTPENISIAVAAGQTYYVHVDPYGTATSTYILAVDLVGTSGSPMPPTP